MTANAIRDMVSGEEIIKVLLVSEKRLLTSRNDTHYMRLTLSDRTGSITAMVWNDAEALDKQFGAGDAVKVQARVEIYQERPQLRVERLRLALEEEVDWGDLVPSAENIDEMFDSLVDLIKEIKDEDYLRLLRAIFRDRELAEAFKQAPGAMKLHHAYRGGLLEHTLSLLGLLRSVAAHYPHLNGDLLMTGGVLHDLGKVHELTFDRGFRYTDIGSLLGHIVLGLRIVDEKLAEMPNFPSEKATLVRHMIVSHHGERDFGSPTVPMTPEAIALHQIEDLDAKVNGFTSLAEDARRRGETWSEYSPSYARRIFAGFSGNEDDVPE